MFDRSTLLYLTVACTGCVYQIADDGSDADPTLFTPTGAIIDFGVTSAAFPPTVNKIGFNSFWNSTTNDDNSDTWTIQRSAAYRAPMIAGLIEPKSLVNVLGYEDSYDEVGGKVRASGLDAQSPALWDRVGDTTNTLFYLSVDGVVARVPTDADLAALRATADTYGLVNFLQVAGTPGVPLAGNRFPTTDTLDNGLFTLVGTPTTGGNWYPLPAGSSFPELAHAFGTLPSALGYKTRSIFGFWQEPSHTISESINAQTSIEKYTQLFAQIGHELVTQCPSGHCPLAGAQLNANDGDAVPYDGYRYRMFMDGLRLQRQARPGVEMPLDYFTIQNYAAQWNDNIMANARVALGTDSNWTPVLMNEWDYCVNVRVADGCTSDLSSFDERYEGPNAWHALHWLKDTIERPDVSHVLLREKVLRDTAAGSHYYPWTQIPILFLGSMSELRRPISYSSPDLPVVASGDADQITIIAWNEGDTAKSLPLSLVNVPATLVGAPLYVKRFSKAIRDVRCPGQDVMDATHAITCWEDAISPITLEVGSNTGDIPISVGEVVMILAGAPPTYGSAIFANNFVRSSQHAHRDGSTVAPREMAHFDPQTGSITVGVQAGGLGAGRMLLANTPDMLQVRTRIAALGTEAPEQVAAGVRVDYLDASGVAVKSVLFRDERWPTSSVPWLALDWSTATDFSEVLTNLCGESCDDGDGGAVTLDLATYAPAGWSTTRGVDIGVIVTGATADATYRVDFP